LQVRDSDGNSGTTAPQGVYLIAWQVRSAGFETSDPFFFVHRTPTISDAIRNVAVSWVEANIEMLTSPPQLSGDYNRDGTVDAADYVVWRAAIGKGVNLGADGNQNGEIDVEDRATWVQHFGESAGFSGDGSGAVPEPVGYLLIVVGFAGHGLLRARVRRDCSKFSGDRLYSTSVEGLPIGAFQKHGSHCHVTTRPDCSTSDFE
jgi:hypothetical protein